jgi:hypothetical protein
MCWWFLRDLNVLLGQHLGALTPHLDLADILLPNLDRREGSVCDSTVYVTLYGDETGPMFSESCKETLVVKQSTEEFDGLFVYCHYVSNTAKIVS